VRATEVQYCVAQWPGVPAWPITQPVCVPMNVTELGRKLAGTGAGTAEGTGKADDDAAFAPLLADGADAAERPRAWPDSPRSG
jgi:hypothetical protein